MTDASDESLLAAAVADSRLVAALADLDDRLSSLGHGTSATRLVTGTRQVVAKSFAYRWLTAKPDPEVIVVDFRETYTLSPIVAVADRIIGRLDVSIDDSRAVALTRGVLSEFRAAPGRLVGAVVALGCAVALLVGTWLGVLGLSETVVLATLAVAGIAGTQVTVSWDDIVDSRVGQLLITMLEPPTADAVSNGSPGPTGPAESTGVADDGDETHN